MRRIEWHEASVPDGRFLRIPLADVVVTLNVGVLGRYRQAGERRWAPFPRVAFRGIATAPSEGEDPATGAIGYISVVIAPWALPIYGAPSGGLLANRIVDAAEVAPAWHDLLTEVTALTDGAARVQHVAHWLSARGREARWSPHVAMIVDAIAAAEPITRIAQRASRSTRRVHQICLSETGHSPSRYRQVARFARLAQALHQAHDAHAWSAQVREYADHSHAIREFRRLASVTPRAFATHRVSVPRTYSLLPAATRTTGS